MDKVFLDLIKRIKNKYGENILIEYEYNPESDLHLVWHNSLELEMNQDFNKLVSDALEEIVLEHKIFNFSFAFNEERTIELLLEKAFEEAIFRIQPDLKLDILDNFYSSKIFVARDERNYGVLAA